MIAISFCERGGMNPSEISMQLGRISRQSTGHSLEETLAYFRSKYPIVTYHGRDVFHFTNERRFGSQKHIVSFHLGPTGPTPEHIYQYVLITYCYQGTFPMSLDGTRVVLQKGDCLIADRHCPHSVEELAPSTVAVNVVLNDRFFQKRLLADLNRVGSDFGLALATPAADHTQWRVYRATDPLSRACIDQLLCEHFDSRIGSADIIDDLCAALITNLLRSNEKDVTSEEEARKDSELIGRVHEYISRNYRQGRLQELANQLGYDSSYLSAHIRQSTARTFKQLVNEERMRHAALLLQGTSSPIYEIAHSVGISNLTQFYKRFREYADMTPQEYRESLRRR